MSSIVSADAKFILLGEHFVVYEGLGIASPLPEFRCYVTIDDRKRDGILSSIIFTQDQIAGFEKGEKRRVEDKFNKLCTDLAVELGIEEPCLKIELESTIPIGQGFGSSAAISVALLRAFSEHYSLNLGYRYLEYYASWLEKQFHPRPSGIDHLTILNEHSIFFSKASSYLPLMNGIPYFFAIASTGPRVGLAEINSEIRERSESEEFKHILNEADWLVSRALIAFEHNDRKLLGKIMQRNQALLKKIGVSTDKIDDFVQIALDNGAYGAKLTGAGCGGSVIALASEQDCHQIVEKWRQEGASIAFVHKMPAAILQG